MPACVWALLLRVACQRLRAWVLVPWKFIVYCFDPEDNVVEVYFSIPVDWKQPFRADIDLSLDDEGVMLQISEATSGAVKL